jgi:hypothetical protein
MVYAGFRHQTIFLAVGMAFASARRSNNNPSNPGNKTMNGNQEYRHGHNQIAAALFVASLIIGSAMILSAGLTKPARYEYHATGNGNEYIIYDNDTGRSTMATIGAEDPLKALEKK